MSEVCDTCKWWQGTEEMAPVYQSAPGLGSRPTGRRECWRFPQPVFRAPGEVCGEWTYSKRSTPAGAALKDADTE